jgi:putative transposase
MTYYRRCLPHWHPPGQDLFVTWRLYDSLPHGIPQPKENLSPGERFVHYDRFLDEARTGPLWLKDERIAESVLSVFLEARRRNFLRMLAYCVMANHVHILLTPIVALDRITHQIKGTSARQANLILGHTGSPFWQDESFDHWIRNPGEWQKIRC